MEKSTGHKKKFARKHCKNQFSTKYRYAFHIRNLHSKEPPDGTVSSMCNKRLSTRTAMNNHLTTVHMAEKTYSCPPCGKNLAYKKNLESHNRNHHDVPVIM